MMIKFAAAILLLTLACASMADADRYGPNLRDTRSDTWVATDGLGRSLPAFNQVGPPRKDRTLGVFYFLWLDGFDKGPFDVTKILAQHPDAVQNADDPLWGPMLYPHHWGEPLFGYYQTDDAWVLRKHAQMLSDAGVDVIIFDTTNQVTYPAYYHKLLEVFAQVRAEGGKTPQVAFLTPFGDPGKVVRELYHDLYEPRFHPELWFRWEGKPLILADPALLVPATPDMAQNSAPELKNGHTLGQKFHASAPFGAAGGRFPTYSSTGSSMTLKLYESGPGGRLLASRRFTNVTDNAWLSVKAKSMLPAGDYYLEMSDPSGRIGWWSHTERQTMGGSAMADGSALPGGRTLRLLAEDSLESKLQEFFTFRKPQPDYFVGPTGPNQWSWLEVTPQHVFKNARGEKEQMSVGVAQNAVGNRLGSMSEKNARGRNYHNGANDTRPDAVRHGLNFAEQFEYALKQDPRFIFVTGWNEWIAGRFPEFGGVKEPVMFVDEFTQERSRDIEPMMGGHGDDYYYQFVAFARRYKGVRKPPAASGPITMAPGTDFSRWRLVEPEYLDDLGDTAHRNHPAWANTAQLVNNTGRNDIVAAKVARDAKFVYFYVRTHEPLTPFTDPSWMRLFIRLPGLHAPNWEGYQFVVNRASPSADRAQLESSAGGWNWRPAAEVRWAMHGNEMQIAIPRAALRLPAGSAPFDLEFKWSDNMQKQGDILDFISNGDVAPNGRFRYRYEAR